MEKDDPKPTVELIKRTAKIYPYVEGGVGTSVAEFLTGKANSRPRRAAADRVP